MKVRNIGNNQTEISIGNNKTVLVSYQTVVAACIDGMYYKTGKKWSTTTSRHINNWLNGVNAEIKEQTFFDNLLE